MTILDRVYIEPTNICNLNCCTCVRNVWDEPSGQMQTTIFNKIVDGLAAFPAVPDVFFGGFGEPLAHPEIVGMVSRMKAAGAHVELITNATLLREDMAARLLDAGLDMLWVSIDGATPESYADIRLGAALPLVIKNVTYINELSAQRRTPRLQIGVAFVAMQRNLADLPAVLRIGAGFGASRFSVSNLLAHTTEMRNQILYEHELSGDPSSNIAPLIDFQRLDSNCLPEDLLAQIVQSLYPFQVVGEGITHRRPHCPFLDKASLSIRWDGELSPCLPLLHNHTSYLGNHERRSHALSFGSLSQRTLENLWNDPKYVEFRKRLLDFDFSPCVLCNSCEMSEHNLEDCFGNTAPTCGGCLWAHGFIQCP